MRGPVTLLTARPTPLSPAETGVDAEAIGAEADCEAKGAEEAEEALEGRPVTASSPPMVELATEMTASADEDGVETTDGSAEIGATELASASTDTAELSDCDAMAEVTVAEALKLSIAEADEGMPLSMTELDASRPVEDAADATGLSE